MIMRGLQWWSEGLATTYAQFEPLFIHARTFGLDSRRRPLVLQPVETEGTSPSSVTPLPDEGTAPSDELIEQTRGSIIEIAVPSEAVLEAKLDPLPAESRPYVDSIVRHQLGKLFPWQPNDVLCAISTGNSGDGKIEVTVQATPRHPIAPILDLLKTCGASQLWVVADRDSTPVRIPAETGALNQSDRVRDLAGYAIAAALALLLFAVSWTTFNYWSLSSDVAMLDEAIATREALIRRGSNLRNTRNDLQARKEQSAAAVAVLDALSTILPDDTYLTDMSFESGRLRFSGFSARATELVPLLENSGRFKNASFYAPTTRVPGRAGDRFSIEASVAP